MHQLDHPAAQLVNLDRYPIHDLDRERGQLLVADCHAQLAATGGANLPGFLPADVALALTAEVAALEPVANRKTFTRNAYYTKDDPSLPADHPLRTYWTDSSMQIAADQIPANAGLRRLYEWDVLTNFIAAATSKERLYRMADPFQAFNVIWLGDGDRSSWHYDFNEFTVTLLLHEPEAGGAFEFVPSIRRDDDERFDAVKRVFQGTYDGVRTYERGAGTLTLFRGRHSLHRVAPVRGTRKRITAILCYDERPDCVASDEVNRAIYGARIEPLLAAGRTGA